MFISPVSFAANFVLRTGKSTGITDDLMLKEFNVVRAAKASKINVPTYDISISYQTDGEIADYKSNKIKPEHFRSLFHNLFLMDKNNLNHNDLDIGHVFYGKNGHVEFDCFRFSDPFFNGDEKWHNLPDFMMPTNQLNYENASLGFYVKQIPTTEEKVEFLKNYLAASSNYHLQKASFVNDNLGEKYTSEMLNYELVQAKATKNPDSKMAKLLNAKLDFLRKQRLAFTEWDEGGGACGHEFKRDKRINAIPMYFDAIKSAIKYSKKAKLLANESQGVKAQYYNYESKLGEYYANTYVSWLYGMAKNNFENPAVMPLPIEELNEMLFNYDKITNSKMEYKADAIDKYLELYNEKTGIKKEAH